MHFVLSLDHFPFLFFFSDHMKDLPSTRSKHGAVSSITVVYSEAVSFPKMEKRVNAPTPAGQM